MNDLPGGEAAEARDLSEDDPSLALEAPYEGVLGRTRAEPMQVWMPDDRIAVVEVYVGVNATSDPELGELARAGALHQVGEGVELAVPFTYHDPLARLFLMVLPESLRHRALAYRAEQLALIAADTAHPVPAYVRDAPVVIGVAGLLARLDGGPPLPSDGEQLEPLLRHRLQQLSQREYALARRERLLDAREHALRHEQDDASSAYVVRGNPSMGVVYDSELEEIDLVDSRLYERALVENGLRDYRPLDYASSDEEDYDEDVEDVDDDVEELPDEDALDDPAALSELGCRLPSSFWSDPSASVHVVTTERRVWLFVRDVAPDQRGTDTELLVQLDPEAELPAVLVTLLLDVHGATEVRRGALDLSDATQRDALRLLGEHFEVELVAADAPEVLRHWARLRGSCESNVRSILERIERASSAPPEALEQARLAFLDELPPVRDDDQPFLDELAGSPAQNATEAAVQLDAVAEWLSPKRLSRARLLLCIPDELIDERCRAVVFQALDFGLSLPASVAARALELGMAQDEKSLLERRIDGLCRTSRSSDFAGLEESVLRVQWSEALEQAAHLGVSLSAEVRDLARQHAGERALVHASALVDSHDAALSPTRQKALASPPDLDALRELMLRGGHRDLLMAARATEPLDPEQAGALFGSLAQRHDPAAVDALLSLLAPMEPVRLRVGAALALAQRRAVHAVDDLCAHLASEEDPVWRAFALALGRYGGGSFRAISRSLVDAEAPPARVVEVYAGLASHGARAQVRAKARSRNEHEAQLAQAALSLADERKAAGKALAGLEQQGPLTVFCEIFDSSCADAHGS